VTRVAFLVEELGRSGGMAVIRRHARHLREVERVDCSLVVCGPKPGEVPAAEDGIPVRTLAAARREPVDVAVATWWTTADALYELDAARQVVFLQNLEHRFYREQERVDRLGALGVFDLPADFLVIATHMRALLERLRPDARCWLVPNGIDKALFRPREPAPPHEGPLRVLVEGQPTLWFKGMAEAVDAVGAMSEPATLTLAVHDPDDARAAGLRADRVVGGLSPEAMAALYAEHDVLLKLSRFEGLPLPPLEAFHAGLPCVLTPFTGGEDFVSHGVNSLVVGFDDLGGTAAALDLLSRDEVLRRRLRQGALDTAAGWPDRTRSSQAFASALEEVLADPPHPDAAARRLARGRRLTIELHREGERRDVIRLETEASIARSVAQERMDLINHLTSRKSYRAVRFVKRLFGGGQEWW
jgi:O-antigen biosynthesis protein